jgi:hypothetical protein
MLIKSLVQARHVQLTLPPMHPKQAEFYNRPERFVVGCMGVKAGKTFGGAIKMIQEAWNHEGWVLWWVAPVYRQCQIGWEEIMKLLPTSRRIPYKHDMIIELIKSNGQPYSRIEFKSAQDADNLKGFKVNRAIIDEADRVSDEAFIAVTTVLTPTKGSAFYISTPKTRGGFFYREWQKGQKDNPQYDSNYFSCICPTSANPYISRDIIEQARKNLPEDVFRTEYLAEWPSSDGGTVFRNYNGCILRDVQFKEPEEGHAYTMGVDLAKHKDFTVFTVIDKVTRSVVYWERFNDLDWKIQKAKVVEVARKYNRAMTIMDTTGGSVGDVILDDLRDSADFPIIGFKISTNALKKSLIDGLKMALANKTVFFPEIRQLLVELQMYEYQLTDHGVVTYAAPVGFTDDCVISFALAVHGLEQEPWKYRYSSVRGV